MGRQPRAIDGVLSTFLATSSLTRAELWTTLVGFTALYAGLAVIEVRLMLAAIAHARTTTSIHSRHPARCRDADGRLNELKDTS